MPRARAVLERDMSQSLRRGMGAAPLPLGLKGHSYLPEEQLLGHLAGSGLEVRPCVMQPVPRRLLPSGEKIREGH